MKILVINGPNLNMLGIREPALYGTGTYDELCRYMQKEADALSVELEIFQSNYEGVLVDEIQKALGVFDGMILNAAAYTHTSIAILDALKAVGLPTVEVHLTDINAREPFRTISYPSLYCEKTITGKGFAGYGEALRYLYEVLGGRECRR